MSTHGVRRTLKESPSEFRHHLSKSGKETLQKDFLNAVMTRNVPEIYRCLEQGARPTAVDPELGVSPIHLLAERDDHEIGLRVLQFRKINLNVQNSHSYTSLHLTCICNCANFLVLLLENGADVDFPDKFGKTPLHLAVERRHGRLALALIQSGATVNLMDAFEKTPLSISILDASDLLIAKILLHYGADMRLEDQRNLHVFFEAILHCHTAQQIEFVSLLLKNGVDVNLRCPKSGRNCLHFVAITGFLELAVVFMNMGAKRDVIDCTNRTPQKIAADHGNFVVADYFQKGYRPPHLLIHLSAVYRFVRKIRERIAQRKAEEELREAVERARATEGRNNKKK